VSSLPTWIKPQLAALVKEAPDGQDWLHELKLDGYRMHAWLDAGRVNILTRIYQSLMNLPFSSNRKLKFPAFTASMTSSLVAWRFRV
jgi:hypothetical protein